MIGSSAIELAAAVARREISARELLDLHVAHLDRCNPPINAVVTLALEEATAGAAEADRLAAAGRPLGPLHGVPVTIKDALETKGIRTTCGMGRYRDHVPAQDAVAVARLRAGGAIVFGKTNTPAGVADYQTSSALFGTTSNPWNTDRSAGGSSGGSAAAVAAGISSLDLGSDLYGSIRNPAHCCGVYGHKPSFGVVPTLGHIPPAPGSMHQVDLSVVGPLARSPGDLDLALRLCAGPVPSDAVGWRLSLPAPRHKALEAFRVAVWLDDPRAPVDSQVSEVLEVVVDALESAGARVDRTARPQVDLDWANELYRTFTMPIFIAGTARDADIHALQEARQGLADDDTSPLAGMSRHAALPHLDWMKAVEKRAQLRRLLGSFFEDHDVLVTTAVPVTAWPHDDRPQADRTLTINGTATNAGSFGAWMAIAGLGGLPATVAPVGLAGDGLPVGLQIIGPFLEDRTTIAFARLLAGVVVPPRLPSETSP